ncbi:carbon-nitrogen hydrolase [Amylocarpus encephaloides]|uniref:nitrilase n=1 Tax=Amylocarpus encephaloides TaxID=45428 RepID=A0A9P7YQN6_9HELO|nr:carbon-nitrogen hydrolase [Amylocarpus encephaloides]
MGIMQHEAGKSYPNQVIVAVTQLEPAWLNLQASVKKTCKYITEDASNGAELVSFAEAFIPGYPAWIWSRPLDPMLHTEYIKNSLVVDSDEMRTLQSCAATNKIVVSLGFSENDHNSLYISQAILDVTGEIVMKRRKLKATHMERTIFGDASGDSLMNVATTGIGRRVGALNCWEHAQPLLKYHTIGLREEVHCAAWPPLVPHDGGAGSFSMSSDGCLALSQVYAMESQTFVLHATQIIGERGIEKMSTKQGVIMNSPGGGASCIIGSDGRVMTRPLDPLEEGIIYEELDFDAAVFARSFLDVAGHYSRPDLPWLGADTRQRKVVMVEKEAGEDVAKVVGWMDGW